VSDGLLGKEKWNYEVAMLSDIPGEHPLFKDRHHMHQQCALAIVYRSILRLSLDTKEYFQNQVSSLFDQNRIGSGISYFKIR
jgi:hypothetical protein